MDMLAKALTKQYMPGCTHTRHNKVHAPRQRPPSQQRCRDEGVEEADERDGLWVLFVAGLDLVQLRHQVQPA